MSKDLDVIVDRGLRIRVDQLGKRELQSLTRRFTYRDPKVQLLRRMKKYTGHMDPNICHFELDDDTLVLPRGGGDKVEAWAAETHRSLWWVDRRLELPEVEFEIGEGAQTIELKPHQVRLVEVFLDRQNAILRSATGSGKTEVTIELIRRIRQPTLVIVWSKGLIDQWRDRIAMRLGMRPSEIGLVGDGKARVRPITIAMQQSLCQPGISEKLAEQFGFVVVDEVQRASSQTLREVVRSFPAKWRLGVSADERRKDRLDVLISDNFGQVVAEVTRQELVARGDLCEVEFLLVPTGCRSRLLDNAPPSDRPTVLQQQYTKILSELTELRERVDLAAKLALREANLGESVLIFSSRVGYAREISRRIVELGGRCGLMVGGPENRQAFDEAAQRLRNGELKIAVGSSAVYQGIDIPRLSTGIIATPTASNEQLLEQQAGRVRRSFEGKKIGRIFYLWDEDVFATHRKKIERIYGKRLVRIIEPADLGV